MYRRQFLRASSVVAATLPLPNYAFSQNVVAGSWTQFADLPFPVQEIYPAIHANKIHVAGGFAVLPEEQRGPTNRHIVYDINQDRWEQRASLPEARHHPNLVASNNKLYALGGFKSQGSNGWVMQNQTWVYDFDQDEWRESNPAPEVHGETVCLNYNNKIHVVGGRVPRADSNKAWGDHKDTSRHLMLDTKDNSWQTLAPAINVRNSAAGAVIDDTLYVVGGRTVGGGNVSFLEAYDAKEDKWRELSPMPQAQGGLAAAAINNQLIAFGGEYFGSGGGGVYPEAWRYDPRTDAWDAMRPMLTPRHGLGAVSNGETIFAVAGATRAGGNGTSQALEGFTLN